MAVTTLDPVTALIVVDLQNDFLHPGGAYARGGATSEAIARLPSRVRRLLIGGVLPASRRPCL